MPGGGIAPTTCWIPNEIVVDSHDIVIEKEVAPGEYTLETGLYFLETGERLTISNPAAAPNGRISLTTIRIVSR